MAPSATSHVPDANTERADLKKRTIPHMVFSSGQAESKTASPTAVLHNNPHHNAQARFSVAGHAIVTGGTGTLGLAACNALFEHGLKGVAIFDLNANEGSPYLDALRGRFPERTVLVQQVDVTDDAAVNKAVEDVSKSLGSIDHLFCFSGIVGCVEAIDMTPSQWRKVLDVNTTGSFFCAQAVARKMIAQGTGGSITFTASISGHRVNYPQPQAAYNVSKAAVIALKNCLAAEWARYGIRTNSISPGYMDTILNEGDGIAEARKVWSERNPTGRLGQPCELTSTVIFLASTAATYINGADIVVDGGGLVL